MSLLSIYVPFILLYVLFRLWYDNRRGALRPDEIDRFMEAIRATPAIEVNDLDTVRRFLEADDGREFVMLNLVKLAPGEVPHPVTGAPTRAGQLMREYVRAFLGVMIRHAGHPALQAPKIGGYVDAWKAAKALGTAVNFDGNADGATRNSRIDYVFSSQGASMLTLKSAQVFDTRNASGVSPSDHKPLLVIYDVR